jgi:hypothetical protein
MKPKKRVESAEEEREAVFNLLLGRARVMRKRWRSLWNMPESEGYDRAIGILLVEELESLAYGIKAGEHLLRFDAPTRAGDVKPEGPASTIPRPRTKRGAPRKAGGRIRGKTRG